MPVEVQGLQLYRIGEALREAGLSRATYFRWVRERKMPDTAYRDRNGRRLFTRDELQQLIQFAHRLQRVPLQQNLPATEQR